MIFTAAKRSNIVTNCRRKTSAEVTNRFFSAVKNSDCFLKNE